MSDNIEHCKLRFIRELDKLERCYTELSNHSLIDASATLRILLFDSAPLVDVLNKEKQLPITYRVNNDPWPVDDEGMLSVFEWKEITPTLSTNTAELKKSAFLNFKCLYYLQKPYTIHDVMKFYAYVRGGIHLDKGEKEYQPLREAFQTMQISGASPLDYTMSSILQVVVTTLRQHKDTLLS
mgnify:CR=1 FL=1